MAFFRGVLGRKVPLTISGRACLRAESAIWVHADWSETGMTSARGTTNKSDARAYDEVSDDYFVHSALRWQTKVRTDSFFVANIRAVHQRHQLWTEALPNVEPFYAVKSNPDKRLMSVLHSLGCGFDCASQNEMCVYFSWCGEFLNFMDSLTCLQLKPITHQK